MSLSWKDWHRFPLAGALVGATILRAANRDGIIFDVALLFLETVIAFFLYLRLYKNCSDKPHRWKAAFVAFWTIVVAIGFIIRVSKL